MILITSIMGSRSKFEWNCNIPRKINPVRRKFPEEVVEHPLKSIALKCETRTLKYFGSHSKKENLLQQDPEKIIDPLSSSLDGDDPLSIIAAESELECFGNVGSSDDIDTPICFKPWHEQRLEILYKFTTSQKLSMTTSFLPGGEKVLSKSTSPVVRNRLEQLDDFEEGSVKQMGQLSQQEYTESINQLNHELVQAWRQDLRVKALKITIQCSKLLVDTSVIQFYPSKFVLITDILDIFGKLVYERLWTKAEYHPPGCKTPTSLPENFSADMVPESAKETCRNWFYKIASIRELVPRLYVEAAILKSYSFLTSREISQALLRLTKMTRGIGDPLVAIYARCYLCRVGLSVSTIDQEFLKHNFYDFLSVYDQLYTSAIRSELNKQKVDMPTYLGIYSPALEWILKGLTQRTSQTLLDEILDKCSSKKNKGLLLNSILVTFKPSYITSRAEYFINLIDSCVEDGFPQYIPLRTLGECLQQYKVESPLIILNMAWKLISKLSEMHYMSCAQTWSPFIVKNFSLKEVNKFFGDVINHVGSDEKYFHLALQDIINTVISNKVNFDSLFTLDNFLPLIDLFGNEAIKAEVCRKILDTFVSCHNAENVTDSVATDSLIFIAKVLHDSVNALTVDDEKRQIGMIISQFLRKINFGRDFEKQLSFYVEARGIFTNIDSVHITLVHCVNKLSIVTGKIVKSHHTRKTASFVRACAAFCFITIPSISSEIIKLQLYLISAQVALFNQCLGQADACVKQALNLLPELPKYTEMDGKLRSTETFLVEYVCNMLSTLVVVPDCPDQGVLYLTRGLVNILQHYTDDINIPTITQLYLNVIDMLVTMSQSEYPYHIKKVDSNDVLYGSDPKFISEINKMCTILVETVLNNLKILGEKEQFKQQSQLALNLFLRIVIHCELEAPGIGSLALNLWNLALKEISLNRELFEQTLIYLKRRAPLYSKSGIYSEFLLKLKNL